MKFVNFFIAVLIFWPTVLVCAQNFNGLQAKLIDDNTNKAIPFATIRVMQGKQVVGGVISNGNGDFQIPTRYHSVMDSIEITCIGYSNKVIKKNQLYDNRVNVIRLKAASVQLQEFVVSAHKRKLTANKIIELAIQNIPKNCPTNPFSYVAYYRDYQKEEKEYVNLNEAIIGVFDDGFNENDFSSTQLKLYKYRRNKDFRRDSITALAYDNNSLRGNKFIPTATVFSFGGNELSLLRIHDAIRNYRTNSYSFVNEFSQDFVKNHSFNLLETVFLDDVPLYHISFRSFYFVTGADHFAKGEIFIEHGNYAIHKFIYSTYLKESGQEKLLYNIQVEYARKDSLMYLNYISFNNFFKSKRDGFKVVDVAMDRTVNSFIVTFNHLPEKTSALNPKNYDFKLDNKTFKIDHIALSESSDKEVQVIFDRQGFNLSEKASVLVPRIQFNFKNIKDNDGNLINEEKYKSVNQFRELFLQKLDQNKEPAIGPFIAQEMPLLENEIDSVNFNSSNYWMNTPLKDNSTDDTEVANQLSGTIQNLQEIKPVVNSPGQRNIAFLEEKTYLQTDKPYYYPGEKLWFKAYMNYRTPQIKDSLSRVLYVELVNTKGGVERSAVVRIENGTAIGALVVPASLHPDNYFLRAYTNWMLNFEADNIFVKPIQVYSLFEQPELNPDDTTGGPVYSRLLLSTPKSTYKKREEVTLEVSLTDFNGIPTGGNLSISITDMNQVATLPAEKNILEEYPFVDVKQSVWVDSLIRPVESGISYRGSYKNTRKEKEKVMVIQTNKKKLADFTSTDTDESGKFWVTGFQIYDSASVGFKVAGSKKKIGEFSLLPHEKPPGSNLKVELPVKRKSVTASQRPELARELSGNPILLKEVVVEASKYKQEAKDGADYFVAGETISTYNSVLIALQNLVPGFRIFGSEVRLGFSSFVTSDPLVIIDGVRASGFVGGGVINKGMGTGGATAGAALSGLDPTSIDRIEVYKYGGSAFYGASGGSGVIVVHTKKEPYANGKKLPEEIDLDSFQIFKVSGYSPEASFISPDYGIGQNQSNPDYRSTIFWQPRVTLDDKTGKANLSFYTADSPSRYRILVEGVTSAFKPVRNVIYIEIIK